MTFVNISCHRCLVTCSKSGRSEAQFRDGGIHRTFPVDNTSRKPDAGTRALRHSGATAADCNEYKDGNLESSDISSFLLEKCHRKRKMMKHMEIVNFSITLPRKSLESLRKIGLDSLREIGWDSLRKIVDSYCSEFC